VSAPEPSSPQGLARFARIRRGPRPDGPPDRWTILAAWGPCGFAPFAPGTFGTLGAVPLAWAASRLGLAGQLAVIAVVVGLGIYSAEKAARYWRVADASPIVIDEVAGYLVTMLLVPFTPISALLGFALFRACDVLKPWPASLFDRMKNAPGVILDDVAAGVWAWGLLRLAGWALGRWAGCDAGGWWCF
jgi:phosphatidylglycerophosphatase A